MFGHRLSSSTVTATRPMDEVVQAEILVNRMTALTWLLPHKN